MLCATVLFFFQCSGQVRNALVRTPHIQPSLRVSVIIGYAWHKAQLADWWVDAPKSSRGWAKNAKPRLAGRNKARAFVCLIHVSRAPGRSEKAIPRETRRAR